jgi:serine protease Do
MKRMFRLLSIPLVLVLVLAGLAPSMALDRQVRLDVMSAVVQIAWVTVKSDGVYGVGVGSGTIISPDGLILTNCHVADPILFGMSPNQVPQIDYLGVSLTVRSDQPPKASYLAEVMAADPLLDLAVIRITKNLDMSPISPDSLNLPYVERGDSDLVEVGDELNIFGYPGIGGETVTFTKGVVSGFSLDASIAGRAWIKTDATIAGGNSGGTGVDKDGYLVGVPTRAGAGGGSDYVDCRPLADTNGDGRIDDRDTCIPVGGFINALRPVNLADPLIEAARLGLTYKGEGDGQPKPAPTGQPRFSNLFFSPGVNDFSQPTSVITSLPSGARSLYLFFDYENMSKSMTAEMKVKIDGQEAPDWGLPAGPWGGDEKGVWWIGWSDAPFADGDYELTLYVDGTALAQAEIAIGGRAQTMPSFSNILFSLQKDTQGKPLEPAVLFPEGTTKLYAIFDYDNMSSSLNWNRTWLKDGEVGLTNDAKWDGDSSGSYSLELSSQRGLAAGAYRLTLYIGGDLAAVSNFWVTSGTSGGGATFEPIVFAEGVDRGGNPVRPASSFTSGLPELHAFSDYDGMEDGLSFTTNWYVNGQKVIESPYEWDGGTSGTWHDYLYSKSGTLPDGEYGVELLVEDQVLQQASVTVGTGAVPTPQPTPKPRDGVQVQGTITDLDTGRPIAGAYFLVLKPGITIDSFQWTDEELYTAAETDRQGFYKLPDLLVRGECYSMIMAAEGYWPYGEDDVCVGQNASAVIDLPVKLEKK